MDKQKNYIYVCILVVLGFLLVSCGENIKEVTFEGEDLESEGAKALERALEARNNYYTPDTYKLEFYTYIDVYSKYFETEISQINEIKMSGYIDRKNKRAIVETQNLKIEPDETREYNETIILKDGKKYGIRDGEIIAEIEQAWTYRDEITDVLPFFEGATEVIEYSVVKESGNSYDVLKVVTSDKALANMGGFQGSISDFTMEGFKYESYVEVWVNKQTEQIERTSVFLETNLDTSSQTVGSELTDAGFEIPSTIAITKIDIRVVRTEIDEKIPSSVFDVPN